MFFTLLLGVISDLKNMQMCSTNNLENITDGISWLKVDITVTKCSCNSGVLGGAPRSSLPVSKLSSTLTRTDVPSSNYSQNLYVNHYYHAQHKQEYSGINVAPKMKIACMNLY